ncbi:MAG TPA: head-tail connector protein [Sphingomonadaceae bacterium]|nr:head-tail connector protein [Sphingomonadaceae bacterium]
MTFPLTAPAILREDAKTYLRLDSAEEDALIDRLIESATALCEAFTGQILIARPGSEMIAAGGEWRRLARTPVRAISAVEAIAADGTAEALPVDAYAIDIDGNGDGWVRLTRPVAVGRLRVTYEAGLAGEADALPAPLKQGVVRLVAHLHAHRDAADEAGPPAAVAALWRPWRRMRIG